MKDYFIYLPHPEKPLVWGAAVTAAGYTRVLPDAKYPPAHHPRDHMLTWTKGRVLDVWQVILIQGGSGWFESEPTGRRRVSAGTVFILMPGIWHRYAPDPKIGWVESWIEIEGAVLDKLQQQGMLHPQRSVFHLGPQPELTELLDRCHLLARDRAVGYSAQLATSGIQILSLILSLAQTVTGAPRRIHDMVRRVQTHITERCDQAIKVRQLAREMGVGYSYFRRIFRQHTGLSPKQYQKSVRLRRVQTLLRQSHLTIKEISERMGYYSPGHLSTEFKTQVGISPSRWRYRRSPKPT